MIIEQGRVKGVTGEVGLPVLPEVVAQRRNAQVRVGIFWNLAQGNRQHRRD